VDMQQYLFKKKEESYFPLQYSIEIVNFDQLSQYVHHVHHKIPNHLNQHNKHHRELNGVEIHK
jgi:hypothetical protein